jgi:hypothetical protein
VGLSVHGCDHVMLVQGENQVILPNQRRKMASKIGGIFCVCGGTNLIPIYFAIFFQPNTRIRNHSITCHFVPPTKHILTTSCRTSYLTPYNTCRIEFMCNHCRYDIYFGLFCIKVANLSALNLTFISAGKWKTRRVPNCDPTQQ